jgi:hypothetical protein
MISDLASRPVLNEFFDDLALPSSDLGPVQCWALARLAAI